MICAVRVSMRRGAGREGGTFHARALVPQAGDGRLRLRVGRRRRRCVRQARATRGCRLALVRGNRQRPRRRAVGHKHAGGAGGRRHRPPRVPHAHDVRRRTVRLRTSDEHADRVVECLLPRLVHAHADSDLSAGADGQPDAAEPHEPAHGAHCRRHRRPASRPRAVDAVRQDRRRDRREGPAADREHHARPGPRQRASEALRADRVEQAADRPGREAMRRLTLALAVAAAAVGFSCGTAYADGTVWWWLLGSDLNSGTIGQVAGATNVYVGNYYGGSSSTDFEGASFVREATDSYFEFEHGGGESSSMLLPETSEGAPTPMTIGKADGQNVT